MATYKEYKPNDYEESERVKQAGQTSDYWSQQQLKDFQYGDFAQSDRTTQYQTQLDNLNAPGKFSYSKQQGWDDIFNQINNRQPFTYDVNGDALYQQYKDQYIQGGKMAMMDTMGQASAMTGGYGNSHAQAVGQQAYQGYLTQLTDKIPELYQLALSKYQMEGEDLYNRYGLYADQYKTEYEQHRNSVADYQADRGYLAGRVDSSLAADLDKYTTNRDTALAENESYNSNISNNRTYYADLYNNLANLDWGQYTDREAIAQQAINMFNDNVYRNEQSRIADAELAAKNPNVVDNDTPVLDDDNPKVDDGPDSLTVTTYNQAVAYLKKNGKSANGLIPSKEFKMAQMDGATYGGKPLKSMTYGEYLKEYCWYITH